MINTPKSLRAMVTSPHHLASQAGLSILKDGGNAIEACTAIAACLAVVYPHMTGIGGDGFWLIAEPDGRVWSIDACGAAAAKADLKFYADAGLSAIPWRGPLAANSVAGTLSGWQLALAKSGATLPRERLMEDAIYYAQNGVVITNGGAEIAAAKDAELRSISGYSAHFRPDDKPLAAGDILRQSALAETLKRLARDGFGSFYDGSIAQDIAADLSAAGSPIGASDLAHHRAQIKPALSVSVAGAKLYNMAPPTQGAASLLILAIFERFKAEKANSFSHIHALVESTKQAFLYRDAHIGDPTYMDHNSQDRLNDKEAIDLMAAQINENKAAPWPHQPQFGDTVWFGAIDCEGRTASVIQSTYFEFGSAIVLPQTGIVWQNRGASFQLQQSGPNALKPGRKPFHTLNPAIARFDDGRIMAYGTMGGEGQPQTQAAIFSRYAKYGMSLQQSISAPRWLLGKTWGEESVSLKIEEGFDDSLYAQMRAAGHDVEIVSAHNGMMGHAGALVRHNNGVIEGASDPRSDGSVAAW